MRIHTAVHLSADLTLGVLDGQTTLRVGDEHDERNDGKHKQDNEYQVEKIFDVAVKRVLEILPAIGEHRGRAGNDTYEQDDRYAVADAVGVDLFAHPHHQIRAGRERCDDDKAGEPVGGVKKALDRKIVTVRRYKRQRDGHIAGDALDLLLPVRAALLKPFQRGDRHSQKLHNDGRGDIRRNGEREQRRFGKRVAREKVKITEQRGGNTGRTEIIRQLCRINIRNRDRGAYSEKHDDYKSIDELFANIVNTPRVS